MMMVVVTVHVQGSTQRARTAWTKVKEMVSPGGSRRGSADLLAVTSRAPVDGRSSSAEPPSRVPATATATAATNDQADPWIEKQPRSKQYHRSVNQSINQAINQS